MAEVALALAGSGFAGVHALAAKELRVPVVAMGTRQPIANAERARELGTRAVPYDELPGRATTVIVATPPFRHYDDAMVLLDAGVNVIVEKPLTRTLAEAARLVNHGGVRLGYAENLAYAPVIRALLAESASIGEITHLEVRALQSLPTTGGFTTRQWGGGALFDLGVHPLAVTLMVAAPATVVSVRCELSGNTAHDTDDHAEVELTFSSGLRAQVVSSWRGSQRPLWDVEASSSTGVVRAEVLDTPSIERNGESLALPPVTATVPRLEQLGYVGQLREMLDDFALHRMPLMSGAFGLTVLHVVMAAYASAGSGGASVPVPFDGPSDRSPLELWRP